MLRIEVTPEPINERKGVKDGREWTRREQAVYVHNGNAYPTRFVISLGSKPAYPPGMYVLDVRSVQPGQYGEFQFARELIFTPEKPALSKAG